MLKSKFKKCFAVIATLVMSVSILSSTPVYAADDDVTTARDNEGKIDVSEDIDFLNDINIDHSFAYQIRIATNYANRMDSNGVPIGGKSNGYGSSILPSGKFGNVGVFFGYTDGEIITDTTNSDEGLRGSRNSDSSISYSRNIFMSANVGDTMGAAVNYVNYGTMLYMMGFDSVGTSAPDAERQMMGAIAGGSYYAASSVNMLFETMFNVLEATNPFQFFKNIELQTDSGKDELATIAKGAADSELMADGDANANVLSGLGTFFTNIYNMFANIAWTIMIPLSLVFIIVAFFLTRRGRYTIGSNLKKFVIRIVFLAVGIPILGSAYTQVLDVLKDSQSVSDEFITQAVSSTFVDFGAWVEMRRLSPVDEMALQTKDGTLVVPAHTWLKLREYCDNLNVENEVVQYSGSDKYLTINSKTGALLKDFIYETSGASLSTNSGANVSTNSSAVITSDYDNRRSISAMISKYMNGEKYSASTFEDAVMACLQKYPNYGDMLVLSCNKYSFSQNSERFVVGVKDTNNSYYNHGTSDSARYAAVAHARFSGGFTDWAGVDLWANSTITAKIWDPSAGHASAAYVGSKFTDDGGALPSDKNAISPAAKIGFSTMGMYTYLTSSFSQSGVTVYGNAPSVYTQNEHYSVNLIGGNYIMRLAFFINMIAMLLGYFFLAVFFVFRTAFEILFKGFQVMAHAILAAVGFYKSLGTVICMTVNMIAQLFISVIFFSFMVDLMFIMSTLFNKALELIFFGSGGSGGILGFAASSLSSGYSSNAKMAFAAEVVVITSSLLSALVIVFFTSFAIRWRAALMNAINSMVEQLVGTLLGVSLSGAAEGGMGAMASGAFNDAMTAAKIGGGVAAGLTGVGAIQNGITDASWNSEEVFGKTGEAGEITNDVMGQDAENPSAIDAAANTSEGVDFNGGLGKTEGDAEASYSDVEDVLNNGLGGTDQAGADVDGSLAAGFIGPKQIDLDKSDTDANTSEHSSAAGGSHGGGGAGIAGGTRQSDEQDNATQDNATDEDTNDETTDDNGFENIDADTDTTGVFGEDTGSLENNKSMILARTGAHGGVGNSRDEQVNEDNLGIKRADADKSETTDNTNTKTSETTGDTNTKTSETTGDFVDSTQADDASYSTDDTAAVTSAVTEDENGTLWSQTNADTDTTTGVRLDGERGLVLGMAGSNAVSDIALGANGLSIGTATGDGGEQVITAGSKGLQSSYTGADGVKETTSVAFDGLNSSVMSTRELADGTVETTTSGLNGTVTSRSETAADGSTRVTTTDGSGTTTIEEKNATTGYEATETIAADGSSSKTESVNGVTTVSSTDTNGNVTSQMITKTNADGTESTTGYSVDSNGTMTEVSSANGVTTETVTTADGNRTETQSVIQDNGNVVKTTTAYGTDMTADAVHTEITSANGMDVLQTSNVTTSSDNIGSYTATAITAGNATSVSRDYGNGHVVTTETTASGVESVTETMSDGSKTITETDSATGNVSTTTVDSNGAYSTVIKSSSGDVVSSSSINSDGDGTVTENLSDGGRIETTMVGNRQTVESYDANNNLSARAITNTSGDGSSSTEYLDGNNNTVGVVNRSSSGVVTADIQDANSAAAPIITQTQDASGRTIYSESSAVGSIQTVSDVENGAVTMTTTTAGGSTNVVSMQDGQVTSEAVVNSMGGQNVIATDAETGNQTVSYANVAGGVVSSTITGTGSDRQSVESQTFATGNSVVTATNTESGNVTVTSSDSFGNYSVSSVDVSSGTTHTQFTSANGSVGDETVTSNGTYTRNVTTVNGGSETITRDGSGNDTNETVVRTDGAGNHQTFVSRGGNIQSVEAVTGNSTFSQSVGENGEITTSQVLESGTRINKTVQSNGDYQQETINPNGSSSIVESVDGKVTRRDVSVTGVQTTSVLDGNNVTETSALSGSSTSTTVNTATGQATRTFQTVGGQTISTSNDADGSQVVRLNTGDGGQASYKQSSDGSTTTVYRNASGSSYTAYTSANGSVQEVYTDKNGTVVDAPSGADTLNRTFAQSFAQAAPSMQNTSAPSNLYSVGNTGTRYANTTADTIRTGFVNFDAGTVASNAGTRYANTTADTIRTGSVNFDAGTVASNVVTPNMAQFIGAATIATGVAGVVGTMASSNSPANASYYSNADTSGSANVSYENYYVDPSTPGAIPPGGYTSTGIYNNTGTYVDPTYPGTANAGSTTNTKSKTKAVTGAASGLSFAERMFSSFVGTTTPVNTETVAENVKVKPKTANAKNGSGSMEDQPTRTGGSTTGTGSKAK